MPITLVNHIHECTLRRNEPTALVITVKIWVGYINADNKFVTLSEISHAIPQAEMWEFMNANPNAGLARRDDLYGAIQAYLQEHSIVDGDFVSAE